ncbi:MAG TPA: helix-turn-helix domain-containing protein [Solirubrobacteraceae bacterium]|nr:helix-turn-helix domain-containing protein [Solirubrobacteraceae bacterium]
MSYVEHPPPPGLAPWLECTWERRGDHRPVRVLPDGCVDIVWIEGVGTQVVGPNTTAFVVALPPGTRVAGARLRPGAAPGLFGLAPESVVDARVPVDDVWAADGQRLAESLELAADPVSGIRGWLGRRAAQAGQPDLLVREAILRLGRPDVEIRRLADELCLSERQLHRRVAAAVGYGPKRLARVLRLQRALAAGRAGDDLVRAALEAGYCDQAHFANDCRALAGLPPTLVLAG